MSNILLPGERQIKRLSDAELKKLIDFDELDKLIFAIDWSDSGKVRKKAKRVLKRYLESPDRTSLLPAVFAQLLFNVKRYDRIIEIHNMLKDMNEVAYRVLMNVQFVCMGLQRKGNLDEMIKRFPVPVQDAIKKMIQDIENRWKKVQN